MKKTTLTFGLVAGAITLLYSLGVMLWMGADITPEKFAVAEALGFLRYIILLLAVFFTLWTLRKRNPEKVGFRPLFREGLLVTLVIAAFVGILEAVYMAANPDFMQEAQAIYMGGMVAKGATAAEIAEMQAQMEAFSWMENPVLSGLFYFGEVLLIGTVASALMALFMKRGGSDKVVEVA